MPVRKPRRNILVRFGWFGSGMRVIVLVAKTLAEANDLAAVVGCCTKAAPKKELMYETVSGPVTVIIGEIFQERRDLFGEPKLSDNS